MTQYISKEKQVELVATLEKYKTVKRKEIADRLEFARSLGDLSENDEYKSAREAQAEMEDKIAEIENILQDAQIVKAHSHAVVSVGATVTVVKKGTKTEHVYHVVSPSEADLATNKISYESPLGASMMHKKKGDSFVFQTPKGKTEYTVVNIA
jgi:transcription elongation factor GreA